MPSSIGGNGKYKSSIQKNTLHEAGVLKLNISKAKTELNWKPAWKYRTAIKKTIEWYKKSMDKKCNIIEICENDISDYIINKI